MSPRRSAFIDVGTNTILCLIAELRDTGRFRVLDDRAEITRLGQGVDRTGLISPDGEQRSLEVLERYRDHCKSLGVEEIIAVGTSALRDAKNSGDVRARFNDKLGFDIRVISGDEEAAYSFLAVQRGLSLVGKELLVIDIGGGSTELIRGNESGVLQAISIDLGSVRLTERYLHCDPVRPDEVHEMIEAIDRELSLLEERVIRANSTVTLVGIAGTFTTLAAMEKKLERYSHSQVHGGILSLDVVRRQIFQLQEKTIAERKRIVGLEPKRADVIFAGASLLERIMTFWHAERVIVSDQGVRYGLLHEAARPL
ncbi:MAG TPA: Ppx/GppA phosphatase family protein [Candidatus Binatia bacterium]|jgi:exopolyphosphatase/guanosine-5'-triphosphate,3'-diphosphate pyrophosphatase